MQNGIAEPYVSFLWNFRHELLMLLRKVGGAVFIALLVVSIASFSSGKKRSGMEPLELSYVDFASITITGDANLLTEASTNGWNGNGSAVSPIVIEGYNITTNPAITLTDISLHVLIRNMFIKDSGMTFTNVSNLALDSIEFQGSGVGILMDNAVNVSVANLTATGQLRVFESDQVTISNTTIENTTVTEMGISIESSSNVSVSDTMFSNIGKSAISVTGSRDVDIAQVMVATVGENALIVTSSNGTDVQGLETKGGIGANDIVLANTLSTVIDGLVSLKPQGASIMDAFNANDTVIRNAAVNESYGTFYLRNSVNMTLENVEINSSQTFGVQAQFIDRLALNGVTIKGSVLSGIYVTNSTEISATNLYVTKANNTGILIDYSDGIDLRDSTAENNQHYGILARGSKNVHFANLMSTGNGQNGTIFSGIGATQGENVLIKGSVASGNKYAGILVEGKNITLSGNIVSANEFHGMTGSGIDGMLVKDNQIRDNLQHGAFFVIADNNEFINNTVTGNLGYGIHISGGENLTLSTNIVRNSGDLGIFVYGIAFVDLTNNIVENAGTKGISIKLSTNVTATYNTAVNSIEEGMIIETSSNTTISQNNLIGNKKGGISIIGIPANITLTSNNFIENGGAQGTDNSTGMMWEGNYWSDLTEPDTDGDGIVDIPYTISGTANTTDSQPLTSVTAGFDHYDFMLGIMLLTPANGDTVNETVTVMWDPAIVGMDMPVNYTLQYTSDGGATWNPIAEAITNTSYIWSTFGLDNGTYQLKLTAKAGSRTREHISGIFSVLNYHRISTFSITAPSDGEKVSGTVTIAWTKAEDTFPHSITYTVEYSQDGGATWTSIASDIAVLSADWDTSALQNGNAIIRVAATDQQGRTSMVSISVVIANPVESSTTVPTPTNEDGGSSNAVVLIIIGIVGAAGIAAFVFRKRLQELLARK